MGIIIRQSIKQSVVSIVALIIVAIAQLFIYTLDSSETYGAAQRILSITMLVYPILLFGVPQALIKFFGEYKDKDQGYLSNFLLLILALYTLFLCVCWIFKSAVFSLFDKLGFDTMLLENYGIQISILILVHMVFKVFSAHMATHQRIVWTGIFDGLWTKIALAVLVFLIIKGYVSISMLSWGIVVYYSIATIAIITYAGFLGRLDLRYNTEIFKDGGLSKISRYSAYTGLTVFGATLSTRIDAAMVAGFTNDQLTGVYLLFLFLAGVVEIPARSVAQISGPIIAQANERGDLEEIQTIYSKSARTLFLIGISIFALIYLSIGDLFSLTGKGSFYGEYFILFIVLGLIKIIPATFASANQIILYSKFFRFTLYVTLILGLTNVVLNYYFITTIYVDRPLTGVCIATAISIGVQYFLMVGFIKLKFGIHPFHYKMLTALLTVLFCFGIAYCIPTTPFDILNIILKSGIFLIPFCYLIYKFEISEDVNGLIDQVIDRIKNRDFKNLI